ncbi:uncharacterized protein LOC141666112 [Apium graveolens]|uniref:uncharacterized protein LOC141666112 n=1 Tax=Apium graveolens TaxID=4045 RepID=UPI003D7A64D8
MKLNSLVTNIRALGEEAEESYVVKKVLRAVPTKFLQIGSKIEQFGNVEEMSIEETVGSLKAHEERLKGQSEGNNSQLLLTEDERAKREASEGKLLMTREEWSRGAHRGNGSSFSNQKSLSKEGGCTGRDKTKIKCYNCHVYGHYAAECRRPRHDKETRPEANMAQVDDDEPALLLTELDTKKENLMLLKEDKVVPKLSSNSDQNSWESNVWYLDNGASNQMTGQRSKFKTLDKSVTGQVKFGDGSLVEIKGNGAVRLRCKNGEERELREVFYIPSLCNNIISLGKFSETGYKVVMSGEYLWVYDSQGKLLMKVK